jgi:hypothetical protein
MLVAPKSAPATPVVTGNYSGKNRRRNIVSEFEAEYSDRTKLQAELAALAQRHLRPLAPSTLKKYDRARRLWLTYFGWLYGDADRANETLAQEAELPPVAELKLFVGSLAKKGRSGLQMAVSGWSFHTARSFVLSIEGMVSCLFLSSSFMLTLNPQRRRHHTKPASRAQRDDLINVCAFFFILNLVANCIYSILLSLPKSKRCSQQQQSPNGSSDAPM